MVILNERDDVSTAKTTGQPRRRSAFGLLVLLLSLGVVLTACNDDLENRNLSRINDVRASVGAGGLARAGDLDQKAQVQADKMAKKGRIFHSNSLSSGVNAGWSGIGENVAVAGSIEDAQAALEASAGHYENMTNGSYNEVGIGVSLKNGNVYVVQVFVAR